MLVENIEHDDVDAFDTFTLGVRVDVGRSTEARSLLIECPALELGELRRLRPGGRGGEEDGQERAQGDREPRAYWPSGARAARDSLRAVQTYPARTSVALASAALGAMALGLVLREATTMAMGGALLIGLGIARLATQLDVAGIRAAGFEMAWRGEDRRARVARGEELELVAELRNRDARGARFSGLRATHSPELSVRLEQTAGEVPGGARLLVRLFVRGERVGRHAIHGLSLELEGGPGLFEVPLTFANPFGVLVLPGAARELL
ncbi:MAG TPA: hypothetical protein VLJ38_16265, partial [Polyangiaceae bacterium]|nr:hypothetical protein [Polyangiaceae bacterium]